MDAICNLQTLENLRVLRLDNNKISKIEGLSHLVNLEWLGRCIPRGHCRALSPGRAGRLLAPLRPHWCLGMRMPGLPASRLRHADKQCL
jgi:hypothetical protein